MPLANARGVTLSYEALGTAGAWPAPGDFDRVPPEFAAIFIDFLGRAHAIKR